MTCSALKIGEETYANEPPPPDSTFQCHCRRIEHCKASGVGFGCEAAAKTFTHSHSRWHWVYGTPSGPLRAQSRSHGYLVQPRQAATRVARSGGGTDWRQKHRRL